MLISKTLSKSILAVAALGALVMFIWPLLMQSPGVNDASLAQAAFIVMMPILIILVLTEVSAGGISPQRLALLAVLTALNSIVRMLGAGFAGIETAFFLIIIAGYVFRSSFGFAMGMLSLFLSALLTGGVGPWLPFQMMAAGLVGIGAGMLPRLNKTWSQVALLIAYAVLASFTFGALMTLWNWPFLAGVDSGLSYLPGAGVWPNLQRFWQYQILTGGLIWDAGRAVTSAVLISVTGPALLATLRRAASRAGIDSSN
jgi:energy-coupling factor transport system substrate-specific component